MDYYCKRVPPVDAEKRRSAISEQLKRLTPHRPLNESAYGLSPGNSKTGTSGKYYDTVLTWNLPPFATCPGRSNWCYAHCYNADDRSDVYPIHLWCENWWSYLNRRIELAARIRSQLNEAQGRIAVRIHSSGDFFSKEYICFWEKIIYDYPKVKFWAYTRSWAVANLKSVITELSELDNINLYASYDTTMGNAYPNLPKSLVFDDTHSLISHANKYGGTVCPEQFGKVKCCADCGQCMVKSDRDVLFVLH